MPEPEAFLIFPCKLEKLGLRYMVSGSIAAVYYGEPRMTNDVDIVGSMRILQSVLREEVERS